MKRATLIKVMLYILSLWLLFLSLLIMSYDHDFFSKLYSSATQKGFSKLLSEIKTKNFVFLISLTFLAISTLILPIFANSFNAGWSVACKVSDITNENHEHLEFLATYIMPLVFTDVTSKRTVLNLAIMIFAIGAIYVKTNKFYSNPSLAILGFKIYKGVIHDRGSKELIIISRGLLKNGSTIRYIKIDQNTCLAKTDGN